MYKVLLRISCLCFLICCKSKSDIPDVSAVKVALDTRRFEQDFFSIDTMNVAAGIKMILTKYPGFTPDFVENILGLSIDSLLISAHGQGEAVKLFIRDYSPIKDSCDKLFQDFSEEAEEIEQGLKFVKYYFPKYTVPTDVITFIGPMDAIFQTSFGTQGDILTAEGLGVGLQLHLGKDFSFYKSEPGQALYPEYISNNFDPQHIPVNSMKNIVDDLYPGVNPGRALIEQMVEQGKRLFLLTKFLPNTPEHFLLGFTDKQLKDTYTNEAVIWDFFLNNELLNNTEQNIVKNYVGESPKTQEFGDESPGNLGSFTGLQVVKKYMEKFPETTLPALLKMDAREIYSESKYKPRG